MRCDDFVSWKRGIRYTEHLRISIQVFTCTCVVALNVRYNTCTRSRFASLPVVRRSVTLRRLLTARLSVLPGPASRFHLRCHTQCTGPLALPQTQSSSAALEIELRTEFAPRTRPLAPLHFSVRCSGTSVGRHSTK
jgi:hypothetical protein